MSENRKNSSALVLDNATKESDDDQMRHASLGRPVRLMLDLVLLIPTFCIVMLSMVKWQHIAAIPSGGEVNPELFFAVFVFAILAALIILVVSGVRVAAQWERGVILRFGKFIGVKGPGIVYVVPFIDNVDFVDTRLLTLNMPSQQVITKDNVPATVDGVLYFLVRDVGQAVLAVQNYSFAVVEYAQATLRDVVGALTLDELLSEREQIQHRVTEVVEERIKSWGLHLDSILLQDIEMPEDLKRIMSRQASAEREKRANITKSEGDKIAASNLAEAARIMATTSGAMKLRTLQTIDGLGTGQSNTVVMFPIELVETLDRLAEAIKSR
ncbi:MAG: slipin family protein [Planctomycetaceae bacterium]|jgi:regulator of protease activity HflC (stomatin/prohibitin superfamily)|nr:slipin family protein [Planctomycetaceae bacterium]